MFCPKCGQELDTNNICSNPSCPSNRVNEYNASTNYSYNNSNNYDFNSHNNNYEWDGISSIEIIDFIGYKNTDYYMDKWNKYKENTKFISWNWPAFFFGLIWFAYRKMYGFAGILFGIGVLSNIIFEGLIDSSGLSLLCSLIIMVCSALFGNQLYIKFCVKKISRIKSALPNITSEDLSARLKANGGITWVPVIIFVAIYVLIFLLIFFLIAAIFNRFGYYPMY